MNIMKLHIVVLIEKYKKVTDVAAALGLKQPTVSFHMKSLESDLGTSLFQFRSGRVLLTEAGRALYPYAAKIVSLTAEAERSVKQFSAPSHGYLEVEASYVPGTYLLPEAISLFMKQYPGIQLSLSIQSDMLLRERLRAGDIPFAVVQNTYNFDQSFNYQPIATDDLVLIYKSGHPFDNIPQLTPEQVAHEPWIRHDNGSCLRALSDQWAQLNNVRLWNRAQLNSPDMVKRLIGEGGCVGVYSKRGIEKEVEQGHLRFRPLPGEPPEKSGFFLTWRKDYTLSPVQQAFADILAGLY